MVINLNYFSRCEYNIVVTLILFLVVISYLSTTHVLCFTTVYPHTSAAFCG